jgi:hypothetical protein
VAWTQADIDALKAKIASAVESVAFGDKSQKNFDMDAMLTALQAMEAEVNGGGGGDSNGRCTLASTSRV